MSVLPFYFLIYLFLSIISTRYFHKAKKDADAALEASYVVNRLMAIHLRAVSGGLHVARRCFSMSRTEDLVLIHHSISKHSGIAN